MENQQENYATGFNHGYLLSKHRNQLMMRLSEQIKGESDYVNGLQAGHDEHEKEITINKARELYRFREIGRNKPDIGRER